jgi:hypothetical protein
MAYSEQKALAGLKEHRAELAAQLARVDGAIAALSGGSAKRGRPAKDAKAPGRKRRGMGAAARAAVSRRMKAYWAKRKKEKASK